MIQIFPFKKYNKISYELLSKLLILLDGTLGTPQWGVCVRYYLPHPKISSRRNK